MTLWGLRCVDEYVRATVWQRRFEKEVVRKTLRERHCEKDVVRKTLREDDLKRGCEKYNFLPASFIRQIFVIKNVSHSLGALHLDGTQRFIRVNVYSCSSASLLAFFWDRTKIIFKTIILLWDYVCKHINRCKCISI